MENETMQPGSRIDLPKQQIYNLDYLISLSKGNTTFVNEMIDLFIKENPEEINMLEKGIRDSDFDLIKASAHKLKSSICFVGLDKSIEEEVNEVERLAGNHRDLLKIEQLFLKIKELCTKVNSELRLLMN